MEELQRQTERMSRVSPAAPSWRRRGAGPRSAVKPMGPAPGSAGKLAPPVPALRSVGKPRPPVPRSAVKPTPPRPGPLPAPRAAVKLTPPALVVGGEADTSVSCSSSCSPVSGEADARRPCNPELRAQGPRSADRPMPAAPASMGRSPGWRHTPAPGSKVPVQRRPPSRPPERRRIPRGGMWR
ncbi:F-box/WD repeat-containing protein 4 isoform X1 [Paralichthys olivaceus]|uniref:F-box/WD repeat-containing protein 4 isoform X1 n=1 Tax=Paralichthys olivaceus TaxID=8255 RepID=UPI00375220AB